MRPWNDCAGERLAGGELLPDEFNFRVLCKESSSTGDELGTIHPLGGGSSGRDLQEFEPVLVLRRPTGEEGKRPEPEAQMITFQIIGIAMAALFFGPMISAQREIR